jgi:hypothetical protein
VKRRAGQVSEVDRRVAASPWVREVCVLMVSYRPVAMPQRLFILAPWSRSENSAAIATAPTGHTRKSGYRESFISRIEQDATFAELDEKERALSRSAAAWRSRHVPCGRLRCALVAIDLAVGHRTSADRIGVLL